MLTLKLLLPLPDESGEYEEKDDSVAVVQPVDDIVVVPSIDLGDSCHSTDYAENDKKINQRYVVIKLSSPVDRVSFLILNSTIFKFLNYNYYSNYNYS